MDAYLRMIKNIVCKDCDVNHLCRNKKPKPQINYCEAVVARIFKNPWLKAVAKP